MKELREMFDDLDRPETYAVDPSGVYDWIVGLSRQLAQAAEMYVGKVDQVPGGAEPIRQVVVCGMGGSAIAGDVAYAAVRDVLPVPFQVMRGYIPPASLGEDTLQIVVSYSGDTEEAIWAYTHGHNRGARVVAVCSGGGLADLANRHGRLLVALPGDCLAPRLALGYMLGAVLAVLERSFREVEGVWEWVKEGTTTLRRGVKKYERELPYEKNLAKRLAYEMHGVFPVVVASELTWPAALRFQTQLNENAKWPCHATQLPEMNHNEIVAYFQPGPITSEVGIIMLRDKDDHPRVQYRQDFTADMLEHRVAWIRQLRAEGKGLLARVLGLIQAADFASYYLACGRGLDPADIRAIGSLKERLGKVR
jgi:glucose/mannose-6-phosphate isomerase